MKPQFQDNQDTLVDSLDSLITDELTRGLRKPLSFIRERAQNLLRQVEAFKKPQVQGILDQLYQMEVFLTNFEALIETESSENRVEVSLLIPEVLDFFKNRFSDEGIQVLNLVLAPATLQASPGEFKALLVAIVSAAMEAIETKKNLNSEFLGEILFSAQWAHEYFILGIEDNGQGWGNPEDSLRIAAIRQRVSQVGFEFKVLSAKSKGTRIEIWIPKRFVLGGKGSAD
jgi:signal transduction histidine kinase